MTSSVGNSTVSLWRAEAGGLGAGAKPEQFRNLVRSYLKIKKCQSPFLGSSVQKSWCQFLIIIQKRKEYRKEGRNEEGREEKGKQRK